jgi:hypothetical protein
VAAASAVQGWWRQRGGGRGGAGFSTAAAGSKVAGSLHDHSHPFSLWEQRERWGKRQQSTSDGGYGQRDGNTTAQAMDGATATRR